MQNIEAVVMKLHYQKLGEQGKSIIILHGLFGTLDNWATIAKVLAEKYIVYLVDQRNHGRSPHSDEFNFELMAEDLHEFIQTHNLHLPTILGHSMGGKTAMKFACKYPELLHNLIVVDIAPIFYPVHHHQILKGLYSLDFSKITSRSDAEEQLSKEIPIFSVRQFLLKNLYRKLDNSYGWRMNLDAIAQNIEIIGHGLSDNEKYEGKTLFIRGLNSDYIKDEHFDTIKHHFPNSSVFSIAKAGHWVHAEAPQLLTKQVLEFIN